MNTILNILKDNLIGKTVRMCTYNKQIMTGISHAVKAGNGTTLSQFNSGDPRYRKTSSVLINCGRHKKFENLKIINVYKDGDSYEGDEVCLELENGTTISITTSDLLEQDINQLSIL